MRVRGSPEKKMNAGLNRQRSTNTRISEDLKNLAAYSEVLVATVMLLPRCK